ncbi:aminotransferase class V-fold PLP-dependent enzyme [Flavivirga spongiicola]|uniref:Aminotransferase class V-fold PLP-dependent enzyme n=1 Tax=Flavivirga spongiicola TaxID=421621 RepID=A0ABU7XLK9_9FLAO|nr:aminotransferase class V-fold PLP-dependent enzyme [Flavivirga sp. MEBiC05379]MDO5981294.1 aminotransferase class V-fold PLP-dependent enzyme [Flavivirga sp. MEBiC05379]
MLLQDQKHLFDIPLEITYLNIASQSPSFKAIYQAGLEGLKQKSLPYTIKTLDYFEPVSELKKLFAQLIEVADYNRIATMPSVSYGIATVANNIKLKSGDEILIIAEQFPSNVYSWQKLAEKYNATLKTVSIPESKTNRAKSWNESILNAINSKTAVVAMGNIHWSNGTLFDLKSIREKTKSQNALLIIDGSQSVGALPFSVREIQPDALICAGYKWLFGPYGCAYAYYGDYFDNGSPLEENWANRLHSENFARLTNYEPQYKPLASRYSVGESGNFIYVKMQIAALKQILEWTPKAIQNYCESISFEAIEKLDKLGCYIENSNHRTHHLFGIELPNGLDLQALQKDLLSKNIFVSFRGNFIRISCHLFNTSKDFEPLVDCLSIHLKKIQEWTNT